jgi:hypothetical protein
MAAKCAKGRPSFPIQEAWMILTRSDLTSVQSLYTTIV